MDSNYIAFHFTITPLQPAQDILIAELGYLGFESFVETKTGVSAYIQEVEFNDDMLNNVYILNSSEFKITHTKETIKQVNWNKTWEQNFNPIVVDNKCTIRATFHKKPNTLFDIIIEPKMSFGTGHHETTHMMIEHLLEIDVTNQFVLDMGCGTGVLAILAAKKGAVNIDAIDIDQWCYTNTKENIQTNNCNFINVYKGDASLLKNQKYNTIIANINRNILLEDIPKYSNCLTTKGTLLLSGFYSEDINKITQVCHNNNLTLDKTLEKNNWVALKFITLD